MEELFRHMPFWHPLAAEAGGNAAPQAVAFAWAQDILPTAAALPKNDVLIARCGNAIVLAVVTLSLGPRAGRKASENCVASQNGAVPKLRFGLGARKLSSCLG